MQLIAQLTDLHIVDDGALAYGEVNTLAFLRAAVDHLNAFVPKLSGVIVSGDIADHGTAGAYRIVRAELDKLTMPYWPTPGNHDGPLFWECFADLLPGADIGLGAVIEGETPIVLMDSTVPGKQHGEFSEAREAWLREKLASVNKPLLALHHPPMPTGIAHMDQIGLKRADRLEAVLSNGPRPRAILCGHIHRTIISTVAGVPVIVAPSPAHAVSFDLTPEGPSTFHMEPPGVMIHRIDGDQLVSHVDFIGEFAGPYPFFPQEGR